MLSYLPTIFVFVLGIFIWVRLTQLGKDIQYIRVIVDELEDTISDRTWVVYDNDQHAQ